MTSTEISILPGKDEWAQIKELAAVAVKSGLLPSGIRTAEAAAIIILKGRELGLPPMVAFSHINVIQGKPTMSAEIMLAYVRKDFPNAEINIVETSEERCVIEAGRPGAKKLTTFTWDMARAKKMGLADKDNWRKQPGTMLRWRCITEMKRVIFPEVLLGIDYTPEELGANVSSSGIVKDVTPAVEGAAIQPGVVKSMGDLMNAEVDAAPEGESTTEEVGSSTPQPSSTSQPSQIQESEPTVDGAVPEEPKTQVKNPAPQTKEENPFESPPAAPQAPKSGYESKDHSQMGAIIVELMSDLKWDKEAFNGFASTVFNKTPRQMTVEEMRKAATEMDAMILQKGAPDGK